jgi:hypothetical protein
MMSGVNLFQRNTHITTEHVPEKGSQRGICFLIDIDIELLINSDT